MSGQVSARTSVSTDKCQSGQVSVLTLVLLTLVRHDTCLLTSLAFEYLERGDVRLEGARIFLVRGESGRYKD